jgi:sugar lactone lactonase YvrE
MTVSVVSDLRCILGEGVLWHPERQSLFWFDILGQRLFEKAGEDLRFWDFDRPVSAAGWVDKEQLLIATARDLVVFDLTDGHEESLCPLEADKPKNRSNDGRADPQGGFWIGTMGFDADPGAIYRWYRGRLECLFPAMTIPNAICFAPDGGLAYFTDTVTGVIRRVALDAEGWPIGAPEDWLDLRPEGLNPDGAVVDAKGNLWNAQWGAGRVACYGPDGAFREAVAFPARQISCPAFGGPDLSTLFATSAATGQEDDPAAGQTFCAKVQATGQAEHRVIL